MNCFMQSEYVKAAKRNPGIFTQLGVEHNAKTLWSEVYRRFLGTSQQFYNLLLADKVKRNMKQSRSVSNAGTNGGNQSTQQGVIKLAFSREEAAAILGISKDSVDRLVARGLLHPSRALRRPLFSLVELRRFLNDTQILPKP